MKTMKKIASLLLALAMIFALAITASAQTITITPPEGVVGEMEYKVYKVFDATVDAEGNHIAYQLVEGKTEAPDGFEENNGYVTYAGNSSELTAEDIAAIAAYVGEGDLVKTVKTTGAAVAVELDEAGYYYITTSTGSVVTINSAKNGNVNVIDKNTIPQLTKVITGASSIDDDGKKAMAQIGSEVEYTATITVGNGAKNYVFHDEMDTTLSLITNPERISVEGVAAGQYRIETTANTITITFVNDGLVAGEDITITYSAVINANALTEDVANNTAWVTYGDNDYETVKETTAVFNAMFTVTKTDDKTAPLEGAGFVIKNAAGKYYSIENNVVSWVDNVDDATENASDAEGKVAPFTGLADGTYTLVENTVPDGYNKADDVEFTVAAKNYAESNLKQSANVVNKAGTVLPTTGGTGTTLFYILGGILVVGAVVLLVTKKRMSAE